jgi:hypothetical protein
MATLLVLYVGGSKSNILTGPDHFSQSVLRLFRFTAAQGEAARKMYEK